MNDRVFGSQAGVFTRDLLRAQQAWGELEVGGIVIKTCRRSDVHDMPYGGV